MVLALGRLWRLGRRRRRTPGPGLPVIREEAGPGQRRPSAAR
ncbi:hypothetical protein [Nocardioides marmotae]|nr:hypothetical protein [Nocardioides marmotae]